MREKVKPEHYNVSGCVHFYILFSSIVAQRDAFCFVCLSLVGNSIKTAFFYFFPPFLCILSSLQLFVLLKLWIFRFCLILQLFPGWNHELLFYILICCTFLFISTRIFFFSCTSNKVQIHSLGREWRRFFFPHQAKEFGANRKSIKRALRGCSLACVFGHFVLPR